MGAAYILSYRVHPRYEYKLAWHPHPQERRSVFLPTDIHLHAAYWQNPHGRGEAASLDNGSQALRVQLDHQHQHPLSSISWHLEKSGGLVSCYREQTYLSLDGGQV